MAHIMSDKEAIKGMDILRKRELNKEILSKLIQTIDVAMQERDNRPHHCHFDYNKAKYSFDKSALWEVPASIKYYRVKEGTTLILNKFNGPSFPPLLKGIFFPDSVKAIAFQSFKGYKALEYIHFNKGLKIIGNSAFENCERLKIVILPEGLLSVGERAFCNNESLELLYIPDSVQFIGKDAITGCGKIKICASRVQYSRISHMLSGRFGVIYSDYLTWDTDLLAQENRNYDSRFNSCNEYCEYYDRDTWDVMTGGEDYPEEGFDWDYESWGF